MRLIDADKLVYVILSFFKTGEESFSPIDICDIINKQLIFYDMDKAVEQLENYLFERYGVEGDNEVSRIIKGGGLPTNVTTNKATKEI